MNNLTKYKKDIDNLIKNGEILLKKLKSNEDLIKQRQKYEIWYSEAFGLIRCILPDRTGDFKKMYYDEKTKEGLKIYFQYTPPRAEGMKIDFDEVPALEVDYTKSIFESQLAIVMSCKKRFESSLFDIKQLLQADLFDSEIMAAEELAKKGFFRASGVVAGVVLEGHLAQVCKNHDIKITKKNPRINELNSLLQKNNIVDTQVFRSIQFLADIRNKCDHKKVKEPTKTDIEKLISGVNEIMKTIY